MKILIFSLLVALVAATPIEKGHRLIKTSEEKPGVWMSEAEIWKLIENHENFIDITDHDYPVHKSAQQLQSLKAIPTTLKFQNVVAGALDRMDLVRVQSFVQDFSSYFTRYYQSNTGVQSQQWLFAEVQASLQGYAGTSSVTEVDHGWPQKSVVARIEGADPSLKSEVVIVGAHQDSVNLRGSAQQAPGADDNASGSVVVLETLRVLVDQGFIPKRTIEFHWYAAEEVGLLGSQAIAQLYYRESRNVVGMVNFDVPGYQAPDINNVGIYTDNVNSQLTQFLRDLVDEYLDYGRQDRACGYGCSDHASWNNYEFASAFPAEVVFHPQMHSVDDSYARVGFTQVMEFVKLSVSFMIEFAEPSN